MEKKNLQKIFLISVLTITREIPKKKKNEREKSWQYVSVNLSDNIPTATEKMTQKFSRYLLVMSNHIFRFIFKTSKYPFVASLCWYVYFKVVFIFLKYDFARLIFSVKKFQEMGTNSPFLSFQNSFSASYFIIFQHLKSHLTKIVHWTHYWIIIESSKFWEN